MSQLQCAIRNEQKKKRGETIETCPTSIRDREAELRAHIQSFLDVYPDRIDMHILSIIQNDIEVRHSLKTARALRNLASRYPSEPQTWAWVAMTHWSVDKRLEDSLRCLKLAPKYPLCLQIYHEAFLNYEQPGCKRNKMKASIRFFGASRERSANFSVPRTNPYDESKIYLERRASLTKRDIAEIWQTTDDQYFSYPNSLVIFSKTGTRKLHQTTQRLTKQLLAIEIDGKIASAPVVQAAILDGQARITQGWKAAQKIPIIDRLCRSTTIRRVPSRLIRPKAPR